MIHISMDPVFVVISVEETVYASNCIHKTTLGNDIHSRMIDHKNGSQSVVKPIITDLDNYPTIYFK